MHAVGKILPRRVQIDAHASVRILENFVKRGCMRLNKRTRSTIRDVLLFEVVRYPPLIDYRPPTVLPVHSKYFIDIVPPPQSLSMIVI